MGCSSKFKLKNQQGTVSERLARLQARAYQEASRHFGGATGQPEPSFSSQALALDERQDALWAREHLGHEAQQSDPHDGRDVEAVERRHDAPRGRQQRLCRGG